MSKKWFSKVLAAILTLCICVPSVKPVTALAATKTQENMEEIVYASGFSLQELQARFPGGKYWNHVAKSGHGYIDNKTHYGNNCGDVVDSVSDHPCATHSGTAAVGQYDCNSYAGNVQCKGFACRLSQLVHGSIFYNWNTITNKQSAISTVKPGDVITYHWPVDQTHKDYGHTVFVIGVSGSTVTVGECNYGGQCLIRWGRTLNLNNVDSLTLYSAPSQLRLTSEQTSDKSEGVEKIDLSVPGKYDYFFCTMPSGFDKGNSLYSKYYTEKAVSYVSDEVTVSVSEPVLDHYIYWHWCFNNAALTNGNYNVLVNDKEAWEGSTHYCYFSAFESTSDAGHKDPNGANGGADYYYVWNNIPSQGSWWWLRISVYKQECVVTETLGDSNEDSSDDEVITFDDSEETSAPVTSKDDENVSEDDSIIEWNDEEDYTDSEDDEIFFYDEDEEDETDEDEEDEYESYDLCDYDVELQYDSVTYSGKAKKPTVEIEDLVVNQDYKVAYANNKKVGVATVLITGIGDYSGEIEEDFYIVPKGTNITSLKGGSKKITVKYEKQASQTTGYQVQVSTSSKFASSKTKTKTVKSNKTLSMTVSSLKAATKYYVRIRTYKTVDGEKIYSDWSKVNSVKTK